MAPAESDKTSSVPVYQYVHADHLLATPKYPSSGRGEEGEEQGKEGEKGGKKDGEGVLLEGRQPRGQGRGCRGLSCSYWDTVCCNVSKVICE